MSEMFCFQCEQTGGGIACSRSVGVCGKTSETANLQDKLTEELVGLALASEGKLLDRAAIKVVVDGLFVTVTNVNFDPDSVSSYIEAAQAEKEKLGGQGNGGFTMTGLAEGNEDIRSLKSLLLFGMRGMAAYAHHAAEFGKFDVMVDAFFLKGLAALAQVNEADELLGLVMELGNTNLTCMGMLDGANTGAYGDPAPASVTCDIEPGPFIVVSGHDLHDLELLLEQTQGKGVNVYTHSEMLPAHAYAGLNKYPQLKGNFGTAWQNQKVEFDNIPAPILFTTNCLMPPQPSYADRVYTTSVVSFPGLVHIGDGKDFTPLIEQALELGGYAETKHMTGINGGSTLTTGFARGTVLSVAGTVIDAVKAGAIKHFFLVGGCDGAKPGRNYFTDFVKQTPQDTVVLTLACGKYRFNDLNIGEIGGLPRLMDMGQCNDAYSAIMVAVALAEAFECSVNELPLTIVCSWYEQKAVCILLTLLALGIKNIYLGPSLPAFVSPNILNVLVDQFALTPISTPEADLAKILA